MAYYTIGLNDHNYISMMIEIRIVLSSRVKVEV